MEGSKNVTGLIHLERNLLGLQLSFKSLPVMGFLKIKFIMDKDQ